MTLTKRKARALTKKELAFLEQRQKITDFLESIYENPETNKKIRVLMRKAYGKRRLTRKKGHAKTSKR